jgi:hypothetical protein
MSKKDSKLRQTYIAAPYFLACNCKTSILLTLLPETDAGRFLAEILSMLIAYEWHA